MCVQYMCFLRATALTYIRGWRYRGAWPQLNPKSCPARSVIVFLCGINSMQKCQCTPAALMPEYCKSENSDASQRVALV